MGYFTLPHGDTTQERLSTIANNIRLLQGCNSASYLIDMIQHDLDHIKENDKDYKEYQEQIKERQSVTTNPESQKEKIEMRLNYQRPPNRGPNNELLLLPGFFYCPPDTKGLVKLEPQDRMNIVAQGQALYSATFVDWNDKGQVADLMCHMDNANIPTHRRIGKPMPATGTVPLDLFDISRLK